MNSLSAQKRLAVFVLNKATGQPAPRLPVYAELIGTASQPEWPATEWLQGLSDDLGRQKRDELELLLRELLRQLISLEVYQNITPEQGKDIRDCVRDKTKKIRKPTDWLDPQNREKLLQILTACLAGQRQVRRLLASTSRGATAIYRS